MFSKILRHLKWQFYDLIWIFKPLSAFKKYQNINNKYSIGITTYKDRYNLFFKSLLKKIIILFPDTEIIVAVNGHVDTEKQTDYLKEIEKSFASCLNVKLIKYIKPQGLSRLWNQIILKSSNERIFMLNDDIHFSPYLRRDIEQSGFFEERIAIINNSFSFFILEKEFAKEIGGFDERLKEISGEDDDFCVRMATMGYPYPPVYKFEYIKNYSHKPEINSFGKNTADESNRYSTFNDNFLNQKWEIRNEKFEDSVYSRSGKYWKLKEGMDTPKFLGFDKF